MPRTSVDVAFAAKERIAFEHFVKIELTSTYRYTTRQQDLTASIDGSPQLWSYYQMQIGKLSQSQQDPLQVSWIEIANLNKTWTPIFFGSGQIRMQKVTVWEVQFDPDDLVTIKGIPKMFEGRIDGADLDGNWIRFSLVPHRTLWSLNALSIIEPRCPFDFKNPDTCQYVGSDTTCDRTRTACINHVGGSNVAHFGGRDWMPPYDIQITYGNQTVQAPPDYWTTFVGAGPAPAPPISPPPPPPAAPVPGPSRPGGPPVVKRG